MVLKRSQFGPFYGCTRWRETKCSGSHGAHPDGRPLGVPADRATKAARIRAHDVFDRLWRQGGRKQQRRRRLKAYRWLASALGVADGAAHIGSMSVDECERVVQLVRQRMLGSA